MKDTLFFLWSGLFVAIAWVIFSILHAFTATTIPTTIVQQISPIKPVFDMQTINAIKMRSKVIPQYTNQNATGSATPSPYQITGLAIPIASPGGTKK